MTVLNVDDLVSGPTPTTRNYHDQGFSFLPRPSIESTRKLFGAFQRPLAYRPPIVFPLPGHVQMFDGTLMERDGEAKIVCLPGQVRISAETVDGKKFYPSISVSDAARDYFDGHFFPLLGYGDLKERLILFLDAWDTIETYIHDQLERDPSLDSEKPGVHYRQDRILADLDITQEYYASLMGTRIHADRRSGHKAIISNIPTLFYSDPPSFDSGEVMYPLSTPPYGLSVFDSMDVQHAGPRRTPNRPEGFPHVPNPNPIYREAVFAQYLPDVTVENLTITP